MLSTILFWDYIRSLPDLVYNTILGNIRSLPDVVYNTILGLSFNFNSSLSSLLKGKPNTRIVYGVPTMKKIQDFDIFHQYHFRCV